MERRTAEAGRRGIEGSREIGKEHPRDAGLTGDKCASHLPASGPPSETKGTKDTKGQGTGDRRQSTGRLRFIFHHSAFRHCAAAARATRPSVLEEQCCFSVDPFFDLPRDRKRRFQRSVRIAPSVA